MACHREMLQLLQKALMPGVELDIVVLNIRLQCLDTERLIASLLHFLNGKI